MLALVSALMVGALGVALYLLLSITSRSNSNNSIVVNERGEESERAQGRRVESAAENMVHSLATIKGDSGPNDEGIQKAGGLNQYVHALHREHGDIVKLYLQGRPIVSICSPAHLSKFMRSGDRPNFLFQFVEDIIGKDNFQVYDAARAAVARKHMLRGFSSRAVERKGDGMRNEATNIVSALKEAVASENGEGAVDVQELLLKSGKKIHILLPPLVSFLSSALVTSPHLTSPLLRSPHLFSSSPLLSSLLSSPLPSPFSPLYSTPLLSSH